MVARVFFNVQDAGSTALSVPLTSGNHSESFMAEIFNRQSEKPTRQLLRNFLPAAELILWSKLKSRQVCGRGSYNFDSNHETRTTNHCFYDS